MTTTSFDDSIEPETGQAHAKEQPKRELQFSTPEEWFTRYFAPHIRRKLGGSATWCAEWWRHAEAITRIYALWMAWEHLRGDGPLGPSNFWLNHADPHLAVLMSRDNGPFAGCRPDRHNPQTPSPTNWPHPQSGHHQPSATPDSLPSARVPAPAPDPQLPWRHDEQVPGLWS